MRKDYSTHLADGRLRLMMCADLMGYLCRAKKNNTVYHPLFRELYRNEAALIASGLGASRILVNDVGLLVDDVTEALNDLGHTTFYLNLERISLEEIAWAIVQYMPSVIFSVNYYTGLAGLCERYGLKFICWEIDPCLDEIEKLRAVNECGYIFTFRKANVDVWQKARFENSYYLPLASNCEKRKPIALSGREMERFGCDVAFVGDSMAENGRRFRDIFVALFNTYAGGRAGLPNGEYLLERLLEMQRKDFSRYAVAELVEAYCDGFMDHVRSSGNANIDPVALVGEVAAHEKRLAYIGTLGKYRTKVWGDDGWRALEETGIRYMGYAGHKHEINKVYCGAKINVDVNRLYQSDIVTLRVFDIMACGGFVLAEYSNELDYLFELDREIVAYRTTDELSEKIDYYLDHLDERLRIAKMGMEAVRARHSIRDRVAHMMRVVEGDRRIP
jgi:spore maturation protein CgeB